MKTKMIPIKACADVLPGLPAKIAIEHNDDGTHQVILAKHLHKSIFYHYTDEDMLLIKPVRSVGKYLVKKGHILFTSRGSNNQATILGDVPTPSLAPSTFFIVRAKEKVIRPEYLVWCLRQPQIQSKIAEIRTGAGTPMVSRIAFMNVLIPVPPIETQEKIGKLADLMTKEQSILLEIQEATDRIQYQVGYDLMKSLQRNSLIKD